MEPPDNRDAADLLNAMQDYYAVNGPGIHHRSHDDLILSMVHGIVNEGCNSILASVSEDGTKLIHISMENVHIERPTAMDRDGFYTKCTPGQAMASGLNYMSSTVMDLLIKRFELRPDAGPEPTTSADLDVPPTSRFKHEVDETRWRMTESQYHKGVVLADIPATIGSEACWYATDPRLDVERRDHEFPRLHQHESRGVFLSKGRERMFHTQISSRTNALFRVSEGHYEIRCAADTRIRSTSTLKFKLIGDCADPKAMAMVVKIPHSPKHATPIAALARMMGFDTIESFSSLVSSSGTGRGERDPAAEAWLVDLVEYRPGAGLPNFWSMGREEVAIWYSTKAAPRSTSDLMIKNVAHILRDEIAPQEGLDARPETQEAKRRFLARVIWRIWRDATEVAPVRNQDHYMFKRWDTNGRSIAVLFRQLFINFRKATCRYLVGAATAGAPIQAVVKTISTNAKRIGSNIRQACATGSMTRRSDKSADNGVTEGVNRMNAVSTASQVTRLIMGGGGGHASTERLQIKPSIFLLECAYETPEGRRIAMVTNMALMATAIPGCKVADLAPLVVWQVADLMRDPGTGLPPAEVPTPLSILVNGVTIGSTFWPGIVHAHLLDLRQNRGYFPFGTEVVLDDIAGQIRVSCEMGGPRAPVGVTSKALDVIRILRTHGNRPGLWDAIEAEGCIAWIGADEMGTSSRVAESMDDAIAEASAFRFFVLDPVCAFSLCTSMMFYANRNQAPRVTYQDAMSKQAIMKMSKACYWQRRFAPVDNSVPLVASRVETFVRGLLRPGIMVNVAVMCMTGYNIDDAVVVNQASVDSGIFDVEIVQVFKDTVMTKGVNRQSLCVPGDEVIGRKNADYSFLDPKTGLVKVGSKVTPGTVLIGKTCLVKDMCQSRVYNTKRDMSISMKDTDFEGRVVKVTSTPGFAGNGSRVIRVMVVSRVRSGPGDKFAPRNGQKGVWGLVYPKVNMPFTADGVTPDIIMNPQAFPSRMTAGQYHEMVAGSLALYTGRFVDATPFRGGVPSPEDLTHKQRMALASMGLSEKHTVKMFDGHTGLPLERQVFMGPVLTQQLKHKADHKINARDCSGPVTHIMRQPVEGRTNGGGLRNGEMEIAGQSAAGLTQIMMGTAAFKSDPHDVPLCVSCGVVAIPERKADRAHGMMGADAVCPLCKKTGDNIAPRVPMAYSTKQAITEMVAMGFDMRVQTKTVKDLVGSGAGDAGVVAEVGAVAEDEGDEDCVFTSFAEPLSVKRIH